MKIGLIGDIHGNLPAFRAVLGDLAQRGVDAVWNLGDLVGYGPFPEECVREVRDRFILSLQGNYDTKVLSFPKKREAWRESKAPEKYHAFEWAWHHLSDEAKRFLQGLPCSLRLSLAGQRLLLVHGSPDAADEVLTLGTPEQRFSAIAHASGADVVLCAHSHEAFVREAGGALFVNPGSVGRPVDGDPRASCAVLELGEDGARAVVYRVAYDVALCAAKVREEMLPECFARMFLEGRSFDGESGGAARDREHRLEIVRAVGDRYVDMREHQDHVTRLALALFDLLTPLHGLGSAERDLLEMAGLLHDIGWCEGRAEHHKASQKLIMRDPELPLTAWERRIVGAVARYHRRALPTEAHPLFAALSEEERRVVSRLASLLRVADGLDASHLSLVDEVGCLFDESRILVKCVAAQPPHGEDESAAKKADLLRECFGREFELRWDLSS